MDELGKLQRRIVKFEALETERKKVEEALPLAASSSPPTAGIPGSPFLTTSRPSPSVPSPSLLPRSTMVTGVAETTKEQDAPWMRETEH